MATGEEAHRPWPVPASPWIMRQKWHDLLFMHWPVAVQDLRPLIPRELELETFDGTAWVGVVPFHMSGIRLRGLPPIPGLSAFPELNVRTYVRSGTKPGVWFFGLEAASAIAVSAARRWFHLPYFCARMSVEKIGDAIRYESHRTHRAAPEAVFRATYRPTGEIFRAQRGTLEYFLTERYCLYAAAGDRIFRGEIDHPPWPLQPAEVEIETNTMAASHGIGLPSAKPLLHFARYQGVKIWGLVPS
jgi:uncharacterized protein YqjF (DUF2071 family)